MTASPLAMEVPARRPAIGGWGPKVRMPFVVFGGMLALQSSPDLDLTKIAYGAGTAICLAGALATAWRLRDTAEARLLRQWFIGAGALVAILAVSFLVSRANGLPFTAWLRDAAAYALFATVPVFAVDAQSSLSRRAIIAMLVVAGLLGGMSWAVEWLARRDIVDLPLARLVLPTGQLPTTLYLFAIATALTARSIRWAIVSGVVLGLFLITGTRSSLILLAGPLAMIVLLGWARIGSTLKPLVVHAIAAVLVVAVFQVSISAAVASGLPTDEEHPAATPQAAPGVDIIGDRFGTLPSLVENPSSDGSIRERAAQYRAAWALVVSSPIVGVGPGHPIEWVDVSGFARNDFTADTPLVLPAKFGLLGILAFAALAYAFAVLTAATLHRFGRTPVALTLVAYGVVALIGLPLGFLVEDKGASMALMLLVSLVLVEWQGAPSGSTASVVAMSTDRPEPPSIG